MEESSSLSIPFEGKLRLGILATVGRCEGGIPLQISTLELLKDRRFSHVRMEAVKLWRNGFFRVAVWEPFLHHHDCRFLSDPPAPDLATRAGRNRARLPEQMNLRLVVFVSGFRRFHRLALAISHSYFSIPTQHDRPALHPMCPSDDTNIGTEQSGNNRKQLSNNDILV